MKWGNDNTNMKLTIIRNVMYTLRPIVNICGEVTFKIYLVKNSIS